MTALPGPALSPWSRLAKRALGPLGAQRSEVVAAALSASLRGLTLVSKFLLVIVIARFLRPTELGVYGLMVSALALSVFALGLEYHYFATRAVITRSGEERAVVIRDQAILYALVTSVALPVFALLVTADIVGVLPKNVLGWFAGLVVVELFAQEAGRTLIALSRPLQANFVLFVRTGAWAYLVILMAVADPALRRVSMVLAGWLVGGAASLVLAAWLLRDLPWRLAVARSIDWSRIGHGLKTAAPFVVTTGASMGLLFIDRFIINAYHGLGPVGIYTFFASITMALHTVVNSGVSLIRMPRLVQAHSELAVERFRHELATMAKITLVSALVVAAMLAALVVPVLHYVGQAVYREHLGVFFVLLAAVLVRCLADPPLYALYAKHRDVSLLVINFSAFAVSVVLNLLLVPRFSVDGAAGASLAGAVIILLSSIAANARRSE